MNETEFSPTARNNEALKSLYVLRQVFVAQAVLILLGLLLMYFVHAVFALVPLAVAGGLLVTGTIGWSFMVSVFEKLPWNRA